MFQPKNEVQFERLQNLIDISFREQWDPQDAIDWEQEIKIPLGINDKIYVDMVSQLYYAEEATISIIATLLATVPDLHAKQYLCTQAMDEARHAQVYKRYLQKLGDIAPINESLKYVLEKGLSWKGNYCAAIVALNVVMEGEAVSQQQKRIDTLPCPLFQNINKTIIRDEARHAAFGKVYMKEKLPSLAVDDKLEIYEWIKDLWGHWAIANQGRYSIDGSEILRTEKTELNDRWQFQRDVFKKIGLITH